MAIRAEINKQTHARWCLAPYLL